MKVLRPWFYEEFRCAAGNCRHNCCIGWEVDVDPESVARWQDIPGPIGERARAALVPDEVSAHLRLEADGRCALLDADDLCALQKGAGEAALCEICREHPRFHAYLGLRREDGVGLCCEEAARLLLQRPLAFVWSEDGAPEEEPPIEPALLEFFTEVRASLMRALCAGETLEAGLCRMLALAREAQARLDGEAPHGAGEEATALPDDGALLAELLSLAPIDADWTERLTRPARQPVPVSDAHLAAAGAYTLYRWYLQGAEERDALGYAAFAARFVLAARLLLRRGAADSPAEALCLVSREVEYAWENVDAMRAPFAAAR